MLSPQAFDSFITSTAASYLTECKDQCRLVEGCCLVQFDALDETCELYNRNADIGGIGATFGLVVATADCDDDCTIAAG